MPTVAIFTNHPECSRDCCEGIQLALGNGYDISTFRKEQLTEEFLQDVDVLAFPGGIGDSDSFYKLLGPRAETVRRYIRGGGHYLGICMGAYWAGSHYFDILDGIDAVQYIKRPNTTVRRSYGTATTVNWLGTETDMYFYDGCSLVGDGAADRIATYANGDDMALIQGRVGVIGCHPESQRYWYDSKPMAHRWHKGYHHQLLREFVDRLLLSGQIEDQI
jgi:Biotin-protein ligase, N terminal